MPAACTCTCIYIVFTCMYSRGQKKLPGSVPFTSVLTVYRGQTVLALGVNLSAKFTACVGEA